MKRADLIVGEEYAITATKTDRWADSMRVDAVPTGTSGDWTIERFEVTKGDADLQAISFMQHGRGVLRPGTYTRLKRGGIVVMSDTPDELRDHSDALFQSRGAERYLIAGLGLGCLLNGILTWEKSTVREVDVVDLSPDVIALVGDHYRDLAAAHGVDLRIHQGGIFDQTWPPGTRWDAAWFDIWDTLSEDNLPEFTRLKRSYGRRADWKGCWGESYIRYQISRRGW